MNSGSSRLFPFLLLRYEKRQAKIMADQKLDANGQNAAQAQHNKKAAKAGDQLQHLNVIGAAVSLVWYL
jgi:hypothetical protein